MTAGVYGCGQDEGGVSAPPTVIALQDVQNMHSSITPDIVDHQVDWISSRFGLPPDRAAIVAALAFGGAR